MKEEGPNFSVAFVKSSLNCFLPMPVEANQKTLKRERARNVERANQTEKKFFLSPFLWQVLIFEERDTI